MLSLQFSDAPQPVSGMVPHVLPVEAQVSSCPDPGQMHCPLVHCSSGWLGHCATEVHPAQVPPTHERPLPQVAPSILFVSTWLPLMSQPCTWQGLPSPSPASLVSTTVVVLPFPSH
jgi:hypothetical protein